LATERVKIARENLGRVVRGSQKINVEMPVTMATPKAKPEPAAGDPYRSTRE
jgi:hypothetical protein